MTGSEHIHMNLETEGGRERMKLNEAIVFVHENVEMMQSVEKYSANGWACVDGRVTGNVGRLTAPDGVLGIEYAVIAGLQAYERKHGQLGIDFNDLTRAIEDKFGGMSCHTDGHAIHDGKTRICAGCGHCNGALESAEDYGIDVESLSNDIQTAAKRQLGVTLRRWAKGLPVYRVSGDEEGVISVVLIADDAATMLA